MPLLGRNRQAPAKAKFARPGRRQAITASAQRAPDSGGALLRLDQPWQHRALTIYRTQGECANPAQYQARAMERIRYFPAVLDDKGVAQESSDPDLLDLFNAIRSPGGAPGDLGELAGAYARLQFVIGDGLMTVTDDDGEEVWEYLSPLEMRIQPDRGNGEPQEYRRLRAPGLLPEELVEAPDDAFSSLGIKQARVWRFWRRHIEFSNWADSPVRPIVDDYETLARLKLALAAEASSRAAQRGFFYVPEELSFGPADPTMEENPDEDPIMTEIRDAMARAIQNPGTAEAMSPWVFRGPGVLQTSGGTIPMLDLIGWKPLGPTDRYNEIEPIEEMISLIAGAVDMPKELFTGVGDVSHWGQWFLDDIGFRQHTGPTVIRFCNDMGSAYLRPAAIDARIENADRVTIWFDPADAVNHPDQTGNALKAQDQGIISNAAARQELGYDDSAAPDEKERREWIEVKLRQFPSDMQPEPQTGATPPAKGGRGGDVQQQPPTDSQTRPPGNKPPSPQGPSLSAMIIGAAMAYVDRGRERAGNKIIRYAQSCDPCQEAMKDVERSAVAAALGPDRVRELIAHKGNEAFLVDGVGAAFAERLRRWDVNGGWPEQLGAMVEQHTWRTLFEAEPPPFPAGFLAACEKAAS